MYVRVFLTRAFRTSVYKYNGYLPPAIGTVVYIYIYIFNNLTVYNEINRIEPYLTYAVDGINIYRVFVKSNVFEKSRILDDKNIVQKSRHTYKTTYIGNILSPKLDLGNFPRKSRIQFT